MGVSVPSCTGVPAVPELHVRELPCLSYVPRLPWSPATSAYFLSSTALFIGANVEWRAAVGCAARHLHHWPVDRPLDGETIRRGRSQG